MKTFNIKIEKKYRRSSIFSNYSSNSIVIAAQKIEDLQFFLIISEIAL